MFLACKCKLPVLSIHARNVNSGSSVRLFPSDPGHDKITNDKSSHFQSSKQQKKRYLDRESFYVGLGNIYAKENKLTLPEEQNRRPALPFPSLLSR